MAECVHPECEREAVFEVTTIVADQIPLCEEHSAEVLAQRVYPDWFLEVVEGQVDRNGDDG